MTVTLIFLALLLGTFLTWIVRQSLNVRPWASADGPSVNESDSLPPAATPARVGLAVFLAAVTSLFALSISAYTMRMELSGDWIPLAPPPLLWLNTLLLVVGSVGLQRAWDGARRNRLAQVRSGLKLGGAATVAFIVGQLFVWMQLQAAGHHLVTNPATAFFYLITALHAVHLLGGLIAWVRAMVLASRGESMRDIHVSAELCALYWHFLLLLWFILFGMLLVT